MGIYNRFILPAVLDRSMRRPVLQEPRRRTLSQATGRVLEIGFGAGANLSHYPREVRELDVLEPDGHVMRRALPRVANSGMAIHPYSGTAETLPFANDCFDTVVSTFTLCSVQDPTAALAEIRRVLKPGGQFLFLEHGLCPDAKVAQWQRRLNGFNSCVGGGCQLTRNIADLVHGSGLEPELHSYFMPETPRVGGYVTEGRACKADRPLAVREAA